MNFSELRKRPGKFYLPDKFIEEHPDLAMRILGKVIVVRAEHLFYKNTHEYYAYSELFGVIEEGFSIPIYYFRINDANEIVAE